MVLLINFKYKIFWKLVIIIRDVRMGGRREIIYKTQEDAFILVWPKL